MNQLLGILREFGPGVGAPPAEPLASRLAARAGRLASGIPPVPKHDATLAAYQQAARKNAAQDRFGKTHVEVVSFDAVTDPEEIALDLVTLVS
jgi:hypothetical protein